MLPSPHRFILPARRALAGRLLAALALGFLPVAQAPAQPRRSGVTPNHPPAKLAVAETTPPGTGAAPVAAVGPVEPSTPPPLATPTPSSSPSPAASPSPEPSASPSPATPTPEPTLAPPSPTLRALAAGAGGNDARRSSRVRHAILRVDQPAPIPVALSSDEGEGTLVSFPAPIRHLDGFGVVYKAPAAGERGDFYVLWPGAQAQSGGNAAGAGDDAGGEEDNTMSHFVVTALRKGARKTLSVVLQGQPRPYTLVLVQADDEVAALSVHFDLPPVVSDAAAPGPSARPVAVSAPVGTDAGPGGSSGLFPAGWDGRRVPMSPSRLDGFMTKLKGYPTLSRLKPEMFQGIEAVEPPASNPPDEWPGGLRARIVRVLRDHRLDALGFEARLENTGNSDFVYDPNALGVRVEANAVTADGAVATARPSDELYRARWPDAGGRVAAGGVATIFFVVAAAEEGEANDLSPRNRFRLVLEAPAAAVAAGGPVSRARPVPPSPRRAPDRSKD